MTLAIHRKLKATYFSSLVSSRTQSVIDNNGSQESASCMKKILLTILLILGSLLHSQLLSTEQQCIARYGQPERNAMKERGLLFFHQDSLNYIAHFFKGRCDTLSIFSEKNEIGLPVELNQELIGRLLQSEGGGAAWSPVARFTINGVWNSSDNKSFAIYDTMRHKLVIMTRASYGREKNNSVKP